MGKYRYGRPATSAREQSTSRTIWRVSLITLALMVPIIIYIVISTLPPAPVTGKTIDKGSFDPNTTIKTNWFSFRVAKTWQAVPELTKEDSLYTYREMQGPNPQGLLQIYINRKPVSSEAYFSRVVPVTIIDGNSFEVGDLQPDCTTTTTDKNTQNFMANQANTLFPCWAGSPQLYIVAGEVGDDNYLTMSHGDGGSAQYMITYRNLAFIENDSTFSSVLKSFKSL
ncbi:hypothetical protein KC930_03775 [Candidatus Saccharibacteria bacterium]|nr:hypothetical protein [Candidatus Saccharibacteria bacterium]